MQFFQIVGPVLCLVLSIYFFNKCAGSLSLTKLNMISWIFYFQLLLQSYVASVLVLNGWHEHYVLYRATDDALFYGGISVQYTMIALPLGMWFALLLFGYTNNRNNLSRFLNKGVVGSISLKDRDIKLTLYIFSLISILSVVYVLIVSGGGALVSLIKGYSVEQISMLRLQSSRGFSGNVLIKNIFAIMLAPLLAYISYAYWKMTRTKVDFFWFLLMLSFSLLILTYDLSKSPVIYFSIGFVFLNVFINGHVNKRTIYIFFTVVASLLVIMYVFIMNVTDLFTFNSGILGRIFLGQASGTYMAFNYFPATYEHIGFSSFSMAISDFLSIDYSERAARLVMTAFNPKGVEAGSAGVMNSLFVGEAWANWGTIGVLVLPLYAGMMIQFLYMFFIKSKKTPLLLGAYAYIATKLPVTGGANDFVYNPVFLILFFILISAYSVTLFLRKCKY
ncbi:hypothetical protein JGK44_000200 [Shewanella algae]|nr:hypothetical protein [Shewanella algae]